MERTGNGSSPDGCCCVPLAGILWVGIEEMKECLPVCSTGVQCMKINSIAIALLVLAVATTSVDGWAQARKKETAKTTKAVPARVHFSGNFQGELEPCG